MSHQKKLLIIGGTGAQGSAVTKSLLAANFQIRILTRDPTNAHTLEKFPPGCPVELVQGSFMDIASVEKALEGCWGVFVNTDGFSVKEADEIWAAMRIFEVSKWKGIKHFVWSGLDYFLKIADYNPAYGPFHINAKARVTEFLRAQESADEGEGMTWSVLNTGPYMEMLYGGTYVPKILPDGTRVFALPLGSGALPLISLLDIAFFATEIFQNRALYSGRTTCITSDFCTGSYIASTLTKVTGHPAVYKPLSIDEWCDSIAWSDGPVATSDPEGPTNRTNWKMWWKSYEMNILEGTRDMQALRKVNPGLRTLEMWMRETGYDGTQRGLLKKMVDGGIKWDQ